MELRHLRYFLAAAETENFTRAAERCFVAQSALSAQIARLEAELGTPLFIRSPRGIELTDAGRVLRPRAQQIVADARSAAEEVTALSGLVGGRLRLGMIQGAPRPYQLPDLVAVFHRRYPEITLSVRTGASTQMAEGVVAATLDLALVGLPAEDLPSSLQHRALFDDPLVAVLSLTSRHGLASPVSLSEVLARGALLHYRRGSGLRHSVAAALARAGLVVEAHYELDQISDMVRLAALGVGVTVVPRSAITEETHASGRFAVFSLDDPLAVHSVGVVHSPAPSPAVRAFMELLGRLATPALC